MDVVVQVLAFREGRNFSRTMDVWVDQPVPDSVVNIDYQAWVTPSKRPREDCSTWRQAADHPVFEAREAPKFKLSSRNAAHESAVTAGYDAFIACDADAPPLSPSTLTALVEPFSDPSVAAVLSNPVAPPSLIGLSVNVAEYVKEALGGIHGQCQAISSDAWLAAGPFDTDRDQSDLLSVWKEEEFAFARRLRRFGAVTRRFDAPVLNHTRRAECDFYRALRKPTSEFCERIDGDDTFAPDSSGRPRERGTLYHDRGQG